MIIKVFYHKASTLVSDGRNCCHEHQPRAAGISPSPCLHCIFKTLFWSRDQTISISISWNKTKTFAVRRLRNVCIIMEIINLPSRYVHNIQKLLLILAFYHSMIVYAVYLFLFSHRNSSTCVLGKNQSALTGDSWCVICGGLLDYWDLRCPNMFSTSMQYVGNRISYSLSFSDAVMKSFKPHELPSLVC